jgi:hypothetical protein
MKKFTKILSLALVLATLLVFLVSCDASESIKKSFIDAGYNVSSVGSDDKTVKGLLSLKYSEEELEEMGEYEIIYCAKGLLGAEGTAVIFKFPSSADLKDALIDDEDDAFYKEQKEAGKIRGNCWLIIGGETQLALFK